MLVGHLQYICKLWLKFFENICNSLAHIIGTQPHTTKNTSRDNPILAVLTFGEGYHNFHHSFPGDYRNGIKPWQYDPTKWLIRLLWLTGLAKNLKMTVQTSPST